jgi:phospholipid/cholesterol/gamma-HCH transport system substrate-binding protein
METRAHHVLIGAFVLLTLIGCVLFALWVAKVNLDAEFTEYDVIFKETVTGLNKGAAVNFNGIQVGEVRRLSLDRADPSQVHARVRLDGGTPVNTDTSARLTYTGITGVAVIELVAGEQPGAPELLPADDQEVAQILAKPSALQKIMNDGGDVLVRVNDALERITTVLSEQNIARVSSALEHLESITEQLDADKADLGSAVRSAEAVFTDLSKAATAVDKLASQAGDTVKMADQMLRDDLKPAATDLRQTLQSLRDATARVDGLLSRNEGSLDQLSQQGLPVLAVALDELRRLSSTLNRIASRLETTPADYLLQRDRPREYKSK